MVEQKQDAVLRVLTVTTRSLLTNIPEEKGCGRSNDDCYFTVEESETPEPSAIKRLRCNYCSIMLGFLLTSTRLLISLLAGSTLR